MSIFSFTSGTMITSSPIAAFDLDDTLFTKSNVALPNVVEKLERVSETHSIVIISNQKQSHISDKRLSERLQTIMKLLPVPFRAYCSRMEDNNRKPNIGILSVIKKDYKDCNVEFYVGDAAGRAGDHSDCDLMFAKNAKIPFYTPEQYFSPAPFITEEELKVVSEQEKTVVILTGFPGSGKSTFASKYFPNHTLVSKDVQKTKTLKVMETALKSGKNVIVDNLNWNSEKRKEYIDLSKKYNFTVISVHVATSMNESMDRNEHRERVVPKVVYYTYRKNFEYPCVEEGFDKVYAFSS